MKKKVSCHVITYNHRHYISKCIEGILMQKTNFEFEIIIGDDLSTDGTRELLQQYADKYPDLIKLNLRKIRGVGIPGKENFVSTLEMCHGKYITLCDGDDYWTDPLKLQKQVDFLEANDNYSICWTKYLVKKDTDLSKEVEQPDWVNQIAQDKDISFDLNSIFTPYCTYSLTTMFKTQNVDLNLYKSFIYSKDNTLYALALAHGKGMLLNFYSAVYRMHNGGIYSSASQFKQVYFSYLNIKEIIEKIPNCNNQNLRHIRDSLLSQSIKHSPKQFSKDYFKLLLSSYKFLGIKQTAKIIRRKFLEKSAK